MSETIPWNNQRLERLRTLVGNERLEKWVNSDILVAGLGAVGSFAVEALARSGIGRLRLVDNDRVEASNCNRQLYALSSTCLQLKADLALARVRDINPDCRAEAIAMRITEATLPSLLAQKPTLVVDAIDTLRDKVALLAYCLTHRIPLISSMGAARRYDPLALAAGPLSAVTGCPLAASVRKLLRKRNLDFTTLPCVYSRENAAPTSAELADSGGKQANLGSYIGVTGSMGLLLAHQALQIAARQ